MRMAFAAGTVLALAGCGAQTVDVQKVEDNIRSGVKQQNGLDVTVNCPDSVTWKTGGSFSCDVVRPDGTTSKATVKMTSDHGDIAWKVG
jgi:hypothetical protein